MVTDSPNQQLTLRLRHLKLVESKASLEKIPPGKVLINTINANSYNTAQKDQEFAKALLLGDYLIPDGASIVKACRWLRADSRLYLRFDVLPEGGRCLCPQRFDVRSDGSRYELSRS